VATTGAGGEKTEDRLFDDLEAPSRAGGNTWAALTILMVVLGVLVMDGSITAVEAPALMTDFGIGYSAVDLSVAVYFVMGAAFFILSGDIADWIGRRRVFLWSCWGRVAASLLSGLAWNAVPFFVGGCLMGVFFGGAAPALMALLTAVFTVGRDRALAFGIFGSVFGAASAIAPLMGGILVEYASWRWSFLINVVVITAAAVAGRIVLPETARSEGRHDFAVAGTVLFAIGVSCLLLAFQEAGEYGWFTPTNPFSIAGWTWPFDSVSIIPVLLAAATACLAAFWYIERRRRHHDKHVLIDFDLWRRPRFRMSNVVAFFFVLGPYSVTLIVPIYTQIVKGYDALDSGVVLVPFGLGIALFGVLASKISMRKGPKWVVNLGMVLLIIGLLLCIPAVGVDTSTAWLWAPLFIVGAGFGMTYSEITDIALDAVPVEKSGVAAGSLLTVRVLAIAAGGALLTALLLSTALAWSTDKLDALADQDPADKQELLDLLDTTTSGQPANSSSGEGDGSSVQDVRNQDTLAEGVTAIASSYVKATRLVLAISALLVGVGLWAGLRIPQKEPEPEPAAAGTPPET
jgi:MFS family permease